MVGVGVVGNVGVGVFGWVTVTVTVVEVMVVRIIMTGDVIVVGGDVTVIVEVEVTTTGATVVVEHPVKNNMVTISNPEIPIAAFISTRSTI